MILFVVIRPLEYIVVYSQGKDIYKMYLKAAMSELINPSIPVIEVNDKDLDNLIKRLDRVIVEDSAKLEFMDFGTPNLQAAVAFKNECEKREAESTLLQLRPNVILTYTDGECRLYIGKFTLHLSSNTLSAEGAYYSLRKDAKHIFKVAKNSKEIVVTLNKQTFTYTMESGDDQFYVMNFIQEQVN